MTFSVSYHIYANIVLYTYSYEYNLPTNKKSKQTRNCVYSLGVSVSLNTFQKTFPIAAKSFFLAFYLFYILGISSGNCFVFFTSALLRRLFCLAGSAAYEETAKIGAPANEYT